MTNNTYIESPGGIESLNDHGKDSIFFAGGITDCPDWQQEMRGLLKGKGLTLLNPRRADFPIGDPNAAQAQIEWEYYALRRSKRILFWFPKETICPIVLYELGAWSMKRRKPIYVGVHPDYARRQDVEIQTGLVRPEVQVAYSLEEMAKQIPAAGQIIDCGYCPTGTHLKDMNINHHPDEEEL